MIAIAAQTALALCWRKKHRAWLARIMAYGGVAHQQHGGIAQRIW